MRASVISLVLLVLVSASASAQTRRISGRVTAEGSNDPVPSATVNVVGTTFVGLTDAEGRYSVSAPAGPATIRVRRIGYTPRTIAVSAGLADVNVALQRDVLELDKQVITGTSTTQPTAGKFTFLTTLFNEGRSGLRASTIKGFSGIKPETATEIEGGFDLQAFDGRARFSFTQWRKQIDDLLLQANVAPSTGFTTQYINGGQIVNNGTEIELGITPIQTGRFDWLSSTTFTRFKGEVTELPVPAFNPGVGSFGTRFGNVFIQKGESPTVIQAVNSCAVEVAPRSATAPFGGSCPAASRVLEFVGDAMPDFTMGFSNDFTFGAFRLSSLFDWRSGGDVINLTNNYFDGGLLADTATGNARVTAFRAGKAVYVEDASFVKLRELTFSYQLPQSLTDRLFNGRAEQARIELSGRNLKTWTDYTGLDPEVSNFSNVALGRIQDVTPYPPSRSFFISINTTF